MHYKAVIFDMDGTLLDSETLHKRCYLRSCEIIGLEPRHDLYRQCIGAGGGRTRDILSTGHGPGFDWDAFHLVWKRLYRDEIEHNPVPVKPGARELLAAIVSAGVPASVVTSTRRDNAMLKLGKAGLLEYFDFLVTGDEVANTKPHPEPYRKALAGHGLEAGECIAIEDSEYGVLAAHRAGLSVIQVPDMLAPSAALRALGHPVLASLAELSWPLSPAGLSKIG